MSGIDIAEEVTASQLEALAGGELLKAEVCHGFLSVGLDKLFLFFSCLLFFLTILKNSIHYSHSVYPLFSC